MDAWSIVLSRPIPGSISPGVKGMNSQALYSQLPHAKKTDLGPAADVAQVLDWESPRQPHALASLVQAPTRVCPVENRHPSHLERVMP